MTATESPATSVASVEEIQNGWHELGSRVGQLEAERIALEQENKALRFLLERVIEHRQKSHGELVLLLTGLVSKLPINDIGAIVSRLVEHNANVNEVCAGLAKGKTEASLPRPIIVKAMDQTKRELMAAVKPAVEELIEVDTPLETEMLKSLVADPELFFSPAMVRATRCFMKGQVPRERIVREFGEDALVFFNDLTTDTKLNPHPKREEIVLSFKSDVEALLKQNLSFPADKQKQLLALHQQVQRGKTEHAQKNVFQKLSFVLDLLHYYANQSTEAPDVIFAQRLPALVEQLVVTGAQAPLDEKLILQAESLMAFIVNLDHRLMVVNNIGKGGGAGKTLRYVLRLRTEKSPENPVVQNEIIPEFLKHLIPSPPQKPPPAKALAAILRLFNPVMQRLVVRGIISLDRLGREDAEALGRSVGKELELTGLEDEIKSAVTVPPEVERKRVWEKIHGLITSRTEPTAVAAAIRQRLHAKYDADELKQSWLTLIEADPISFIRIFCQFPYLPDGTTDPIARTVMETYVTRLTHEKYAAAYTKVANSLKNMFKANPNSPTLLNFLSLTKWVDADAATKMSAHIGMHAVTAA